MSLMMTVTVELSRVSGGNTSENLWKAGFVMLLRFLASTVRMSLFWNSQYSAVLLTSAFSQVPLWMVSNLTTLVGEFSVMLMVRIRVNL